MMNKIETGLTDSEVLERREKYGENILTPPPETPLWKQYLEKFQDPLIIILLIAGACSLGISFYEYYGLSKEAVVFFEPVGIFMAILLATGLAFIFELKANKEFSLLNQVNDDEPVHVIRNGNAVSIPKKDVVVDDIVLLSTGEEVPADGELLEAISLTLDESTLTGEPVCSKTTVPEHFDPEATFPSNHVMRGTKIMEGHGICRVFAVGSQTENGKVYQAAQIDDSVKTPLNEQLDGLGALITKFSYLFAILIFVGRIAVYLLSSDQPFVLVDFIAYCLQTIMIGVTLIVVAVPEGLPMAVTLSLAYSMRRMLQTNNLVRKMHACETMGAATVICTDKTGTLTQNQMTVAETNFYGLSGLGDDDFSLAVKEGIALNSTAQLDLSNPDRASVLGNPTEGALLLWLKDQSADYREIREKAEVLEEVPFSTMRKYMATLAKSANGKTVLYVKGAPEIVRSMCHSMNAGVADDVLTRQLKQYQEQAMRTLGFAFQVVKPDEKVIEDGKVIADRLIFMGVVAISDPVRADVPPAIQQCLDAGIKVKIVTGDTSGTAKEIGRQIGLWTPQDTERNCITGPEFAELSDAELDDRVLDLKIISRARPLDKERLVKALQRKNEVVAVTGDGTNDAPALNVAHVGLSMGDGTSVAKEASDITIIDNSFASIGRAVMWGRSLYQNIQRFILFQTTVNVAACFTVLFGAFMGTESPLTVTQMLWVNLIMDTFAAMALASLPPHAEVMQSPPRDRKAFIINKAMWHRIIGVGGFFFVFLILLFWFLEHHEVTSLTNFAVDTVGGKELTPYELSLFFTIFVMLQFWNMFNAKAFETKGSALHFKGCSGFGFVAAVILIGQILIVSIGGNFFNVVPISLSDWVIIILGTSLVLWIGEAARLLTKGAK